MPFEDACKSVYNMLIKPIIAGFKSLIERTAENTTYIKHEKRYKLIKRYSRQKLNLNGKIF